MLTVFPSMHSGFSPDQHLLAGLTEPPSPEDEQKLLLYINLKLRDLDCPTFALRDERDFAGLMEGLLALSHEKDRLLSTYLCPVDQRIQNFLYDTLQDVVEGAVGRVARTSCPSVGLISLCGTGVPPVELPGIGSVARASCRP
ncbi:MAG TPA: hypothetical protein VFD66_00170 [Verrucomicrobiae bacterium]|nr:hypothetical protein [Verrucomicrobiae bacterium]